MSAHPAGRRNPTPAAARRRIVRRRGLATALLGALLALAACDRGARSGSEVPADTAADGLSQEELQQQAQPMTREQAVQAGIMDTTEAEQPAPVGPDARGPLLPADTLAPPSP